MTQSELLKKLAKDEQSPEMREILLRTASNLDEEEEDEESEEE